MKARNSHIHILLAVTCFLLLSCSSLFAQENDSNNPHFLSLGNETYIQINNILVKSSKVSLDLGSGTVVNIDKLVVLDSIAAFSDSSSDTVISKNIPVVDDVVVLTRYTSNEELVRATVAMSATQIETDVAATVAGNDITTDDMFGTQGGYVHPFLSIHGEYTDNLYNLNVDERENFLTVISPGIWAGVPRTNEIPISVSPYNAAVGGVRFSQASTSSYNRFQTYMLATLDYNMYSEDSEIDYTAWRVEGMYQQNLPAGISVRLLDRYSKDRDKYDLGSFDPDDFTLDQNGVQISSGPSYIRDYSNNLALLGVNLDMSERFSGQFNYTNFWLNYDEESDEWLNRVDNNFDLSLSYKHSPKTSVFVQYAHALLNYNADESNDSENIFVGGGVSWKNSSKSALIVKGGYQYKEYSNNDDDSPSTFSMEGQFNYLVTDKTKVAVSVYKALEETDNIQYKGMDTTALKFRYDQRFSYRVQAFMEFLHESHDYDGSIRPEYADLTSEARKDTWFSVRPGIQYFFRDWLTGELAYTYENRDSNDNVYDFTSQTIFAGLNVSF